MIEIEPWSLPLPPSPTGLKRKRHQGVAARFALSRSASYLRLCPGLGKTIVAACVAVASGGRVLYVSPPSLVLNVLSEFEKWAPGLRVGIMGPKGLDTFGLDVLIVPDSIIGRREVYETAAYFGAVAVEPTTLIVDEAHRFKNAATKRTKGLFACDEPYERKTLMSGTPLPNRLMELYAILSRYAPETIEWRNEFRYGVRYCAGHKGKFGWDFKGASNIKELQRAVLAPSGPFMLKMTKELLDLPPKSEAILVVGDKLKGEVAKLDRAAKKQYGENVDELIERRLAAKVGKDEIHMATYRRLLGLEKVSPVAAHVRMILEDTESAVLLFCLHVEVVERFIEKLGKFNPYVITGATSRKQRKLQVDDFQRNKRRNLFVGNLTAMGEGNTLTKADRVVIAEPDWVPGKNTQGGDRAHRIGQEKPVHVEYVVYKNSMDKIVIESVLRKRQDISHF